MADYKELCKRLRSQANLERYYHASGKVCDDAANAIEELLRIGAKMHTWIFLHTTDEQAAYDEIGLTDEQNALFGYSGQMILEAAQPLDEDSEGRDNDQPPEDDAAGFDMVGF